MLIRDIITERKQLNEAIPLLAVLFYAVNIGLGIYAGREALNNIYRLSQEYARGDVTREELIQMAGAELADAIIAFVLAYGATKLLSLPFNGFVRLWNKARNTPQPPITRQDVSREIGKMGGATAVGVGAHSYQAGS